MINIENISKKDWVKIKLDAWGYCKKEGCGFSYAGVVEGKVSEIYNKDKKLLVDVTDGENMRKIKYSIRDILEHSKNSKPKH